MSLYQDFSPQEIAVLQARAQRAAQQEQDPDQAQTHNALRLTLNGERYAVPIDALQSVYPRLNVTRVPGAPAYVSGIANVRGRILPVLDLGLLLSAGAAPADDSDGIIVAGHADMTVAFRVQAIGDVLPYREAELEPLSSEADAPNGRAYLRALLPDGTALLDIAALLSDPAIEVNQDVN